MTQAFDELPWHDAEILDIVIDRRSQWGAWVQVALTVKWPTGPTECLEFQDCREFEAQLHLNYSGPENVFGARIADDNEGLATFRETWRKVAPLNCYEIETSTSGGIIRAYAQGYTIRPCNPYGLNLKALWDTVARLWYKGR